MLSPEQKRERAAAAQAAALMRKGISNTAPRYRMQATPPQPPPVQQKELSLSIEEIPLAPPDTTTVSMASIPERAGGMVKRIHELLPQCDALYLYLNRYEKTFHVPEFDNAKVHVIREEDIGPRGKFWAADKVHGYFLTVDDDLIYPADYVSRMVACIDKYQREAIVGAHGTVFARDPNPRLNWSRILFSHAAPVQDDCPCHMLGTGALAYHTSTFDIKWTYFYPGKIDGQTARMAQQQRIPMLTVAHPDNWIPEDLDYRYVNALRHHVEFSKVEQENNKAYAWQLFIAPTWRKSRKYG